MLYVLDEPSIGLHPRDIHQLLAAVKQLRDRGNTVVIVEHEEAMIRAADQIVEIGPGAGERGGRIVFQGTPAGNGKLPRKPHRRLFRRPPRLRRKRQAADAQSRLGPPGRRGETI